MSPVATAYLSILRYNLLYLGIYCLTRRLLLHKFRLSPMLLFRGLTVLAAASFPILFLAVYVDARLLHVYVCNLISCPEVEIVFNITTCARFQKFKEMSLMEYSCSVR